MSFEIGSLLRRGCALRPVRFLLTVRGSSRQSWARNRCRTTKSCQWMEPLLLAIEHTYATTSRCCYSPCSARGDAPRLIVGSPVELKDDAASLGTADLDVKEHSGASHFVKLRKQICAQVTVAISREFPRFAHPALQSTCAPSARLRTKVLGSASPITPGDHHCRA